MTYKVKKPKTKCKLEIIYLNSFVIKKTFSA